MNDYLQFIENSRDLEKSFLETYPISREGFSLLELIAAKHSANVKLTVMYVKSLRKYGAPSSIHRSLTHLLELGLIRYGETWDDRRVRYLIPTPLALEYFEKIGDVMLGVLHRTSSPP